MIKIKFLKLNLNKLKNIFSYIIGLLKIFSGSRRWQRRFFVLYELGTLNWSLDDEAETDPAGMLDLNKPYNVSQEDD